MGAIIGHGRPLVAFTTLLLALFTGACATRKESTCGAITCDKDGKPQNVVNKGGRVLMGYVPGPLSEGK